MVSIIIHVPIKNKYDMQECVHFRTTSLVLHAAKIVLKILIKGLRIKHRTFLAQIKMVLKVRHSRRNSSIESIVQQKPRT